MKIRFKYILPVALIAITATLVSCESGKKHPGYEYMPDMYRGPAYEANSANNNFKDSVTDRQSVPGTIATVMNPNDADKRVDYLPYAYQNSNEGYEAAGLELKNPFAATPENIERGKQKYEIYCVHCHGAKGMGDGATAQHNGPKPPAYNSDQLKDITEGKMFHSIHFGKNAMGSHASQISKSDRWRIVLYVQTLQHSGAAATPSAAPADTVKKS